MPYPIKMLLGIFITVFIGGMLLSDASVIRVGIDTAIAFFACATVVYLFEWFGNRFLSHDLRKEKEAIIADNETTLTNKENPSSSNDASNAMEIDSETTTI